MVDDYSEWIQPPLRDCYFLTGPTASGKTPLALELAEAVNAEIISMDSMAIYKGMDVGTAKPSLEERQRVPHHLIDIIEPTGTYSVSEFVMSAHETAREIRNRGKKVLVCGGTPLYLKSLVRGLFLGPEADWDFRNSVEADIEAHGLDALKERLQQVDPLSAHNIHANDSRRMVRALEVARITGRPLSHWQQQFETPAPKSECRVAVIRLERSWLHQRINARVDQMIDQGLQAEVEHLLARHGELGRTAAQAVGYREFIQLVRGELTLEQVVEEIKAHTRQFARRQEIWFRGLDELQGLDIDEGTELSELVSRAKAIFEEG